MPEMPYNVVQPQYIQPFCPIINNNQSIQQASTCPYSPQVVAWNPYMNEVMRAQVMPMPKKGNGYTELTPINVPVLNTQGRMYKLDNGQNVVIIPKKGPTTIKTYVSTGSFNEAKNRGISHYIEHNLFNGCNSLGPNEFVEKVTATGGQYNASTDTSNTNYWVRSPLHKDTDLSLYLKMHADMLMYPTFADNMLEKEKGPVISEIQMYQDDPYDKVFNTVIKNLYGIKADYQGLIAGSSKIIQNLNRNDVLEYYNQNYRPDKMTTVIVGDVEPEKTMDILSPLFNKKQVTQEQLNKPQFDEPLNLIQKTVREDITSPNINTEIVALGFSGPKNNDLKGTMTSGALLTALTGYANSRLIKALKPLNATPVAEMQTMSSNLNNPQMLQILANFKTGQQEDGLKTIWNTVNEMAQNPVSNEELTIIKNTMKDNLSGASESSTDIATLVGDAMVGHGDIAYYTEKEKLIDSITPQDIQNAAKQFLDLNKASVVMLHPQTTKQVGFGSNHVEKFKFNDIKEYDLNNNLRVVVNNNPQATKASVNLMLKTDKDATLKPGVANILGRMLAKSTKNYNGEQLNQLVDTYKLDIDVIANSNGLFVSSSTTKGNLPIGIRVMKEILLNANLNEEYFKKVKGEIKNDYNSVTDSPDERALEALHPDAPEGNTRRKILENIDKVTLDDVKEMYNYIISNSQGTAVIDGQFNMNTMPDQMLFNELHAGLKLNKPYHTQPERNSVALQQNIVITEAKDRDQAEITQVYKIRQGKNIKDHAALVVLNEILGGNSNSRLFTDLREKQKLAYRVNSHLEGNNQYKNLILSIKTTTEDDLKGASYDNLKKSIDGFKMHINKLMTEPVSEKELETAKLEIKTGIAESMQYSYSRAFRLQNGLPTEYGAHYTSQFIDAIEQITPLDIQSAAKVYLSQPSVISLIASPNTINNSKPYLESLGGKIVNY